MLQTYLGSTTDQPETAKHSLPGKKNVRIAEKLVCTQKQETAEERAGKLQGVTQKRVGATQLCNMYGETCEELKQASNGAQQREAWEITSEIFVECQQQSREQILSKFASQDSICSAEIS